MHLRVVALVLGLGACNSASRPSTVETTSASVTSIARHETYSVTVADHPPPGYEPTASLAEPLARLRRDVDTELQRRGYTPVNDGELVVRIAAGARTVAREPRGRNAAFGAPSTPSTESQLVVDVFDRASGTNVLHGVVPDVPPGEPRDERIAAAVSRIFASVPRQQR